MKEDRQEDGRQNIQPGPFKSKAVMADKHNNSQVKDLERKALLHLRI